MNIKVRILSSKIVKAGDVYLAVKDSTDSTTIDARMVAINRGDDGQDYAFVITQDGKVHRIKLTFVTVVDQDYISVNEEVVEPEDDSKDLNNWWGGNSIWDKFDKNKNKNK